MKATTTMHVLRAALAGGVFALALGSCGKVAEEDELSIDSNTNWLMRCDADEQCSGSLRCYCGQCSQPCAQSTECQLLEGAECASSGGAVCTDGSGASAGGLCVLGCSQDAECGPDFTCTDRQCLPKPCSNGFMSSDDMYELVANDAPRIDENDRDFARYISLANRWSYAACASTLTSERQALFKLLNSLSRAPVITTPALIDADETLYRIDLRDYDWDRAIEVAGRSYADIWDAIVANNPYALEFVGDDADDARVDTGAAVPVMFADSLMATATRSDVYYAILGVPPGYPMLLEQLGVDAAGPEVKAGYSGMPEVIATRRDLGVRSGYLWEIAAVDGPEGSLFRNPLLVPTGERQLVFTLPNGLSAFAYMNAQGVRIDDSTTFLDSSANNFRASVPRTPFRWHSTKPAVRDEVRDFVTDNPDDYTPEVRAGINAAFPGASAIAALIDADYEAFTRPAVEQARVDVRLPEPISVALDDYNADMTLEDVAGDLMVTPDDLEENLNLLDPAFGVLGEGGTMDRDDVALLYRQALCTLAVVNDNRPPDDVCF